MTALTAPLPRRHPRTFLALALAAWASAYATLEPLAHALTAALPVAKGSALAEAIAFFLYDAPKVLLLLAGVTFAMGIVNTWFTPQRTLTACARSRSSSPSTG